MISFAPAGLGRFGGSPSDKSLGYFRSSLRDFPSEVPSVLVTYRFDGPADDIYATMVVRLHHTVAFQSTELWKSAAVDFKTQTGTKLGFTLTRETEGRSRLEILGVPHRVSGNANGVHQDVRRGD